MAEISALRQALVDKVKADGHIRSPRIERAFREVPRDLFLPGVAVEEVYRDRYIITKTVAGEAVSSSSQPQIMAVMLEQLGLEPGHRVLEIGAGTGYNAALIAHIVGETGDVTTVDIDQDIVDEARTHLAAAGFDRVRVICRDGGFGYSEAAPYDRIILTVGAGDVAPAWREQLKRGGRLVLPLMVGGAQKSVAFEPGDRHLVSVSVKECLFIPLRGAFAPAVTRLPLGPASGLSLWVRDPGQVNTEAAYALLTGPPRDTPAAVRLTPPEVYGGLIPWMALHEPGVFCWFEAEGPSADGSAVPYLFALAGKYCSSAGLFEEHGACFLMRPPCDASPAEQAANPPAFDLFVRGFGDDEALVRRLLDEVQAWNAAGRPGTEGLRIRAYPTDVDYHAAAGEIVVPNRWTCLVLDWSGDAPPA
ncbi:MAG TPA: methyltransferase, FxLD system [Methylomirabilota bacterium]|jgi:protein-L-isoaspartate(D-aspartate) O-methyltransferase|nr:methyltransferase, FxLD system [Methylomirabilota bacterium]